MGLTCLGLGKMMGLGSVLSSVFSVWWFSSPFCAEGESSECVEIDLGITLGQVFFSSTFGEVFNNHKLSVGGRAAEGDPPSAPNKLES